MWGRWRKTASHKPEGEASGETEPAHTLILDSGLLDREQINFCGFKPPNLWSFVMAALEHQYKVDGYIH